MIDRSPSVHAKQNGVLFWMSFGQSSTPTCSMRNCTRGRLPHWTAQWRGVSPYFSLTYQFGRYDCIILQAQRSASWQARCWQYISRICCRSMMPGCCRLAPLARSSRSSLWLRLETASNRRFFIFLSVIFFSKKRSCFLGRTESWKGWVTSSLCWMSSKAVMRGSREKALPLFLRQRMMVQNIWHLLSTSKMMAYLKLAFLKYSRYLWYRYEMRNLLPPERTKVLSYYKWVFTVPATDSLLHQSSAEQMEMRCCMLSCSGGGKGCYLQTLSLTPQRSTSQPLSSQSMASMLRRMADSAVWTMSQRGMWVLKSSQRYSRLRALTVSCLSYNFILFFYNFIIILACRSTTTLLASSQSTSAASYLSSQVCTCSSAVVFLLATCVCLRVGVYMRAVVTDWFCIGILWQSHI